MIKSRRIHEGPMPGYEDGVIGPIAQSVDDIELACRACFGAKYYESDTVIPIPYREVELKKVFRSINEK